ncbi:MAG: ABC transporter permease [Lentisphaerae bacterium]|nr:ABC transporter permease [Lentisphaerota bacterium]
MSHLLDTLRDAIDGLRARPGRAMLAAATMATGIAILAALLGALAGLNRQAAQIVGDFGADVIALLPATPADTPGGGLPADTRDVLRRNLPGVQVSSARLYRNQAVDNRHADIWAGDADLPRVRAWPLHAGRGLDPRDVRNARRVCVLSRTLSDDLHRGLHDAVNVMGLSLTVIGIVAPSGSGRDVDARLAPGDRFLLVPRSLRPDWILSPQPPSANDDVLFLKTGRPESVARVLAAAQRLLARPATGHTRDDAWITPEHLLQGIRRLQTTLSWSAGSIAALCLLLGGVTLLGVMLARVQERVPEIGLRLALGASRADIAALFIAEAVLISAVAAVGGVGAWLSALVLLPAAALPLELVVTPAGILVPVLVSTLTAVLFTGWPALLAARISPYAALRNE